jgi:RNA polymerase sigma-70 factor (ECF subfamily)
VQELAMSRGQTDRADFDALIGPHLDAGYRTALAILRDPDAAHDAVQESAFKAWRKLNQLQEGKPARPWFLAIVANQCRSERRRHWWSVIRMAEVETDANRPAESSAENVDIDRELAKLPREDRLALFLYFYLDLPIEEVGAVLGVSAGGAKTRVYRAARKLRPGLEMN